MPRSAKYVEPSKQLMTPKKEYKLTWKEKFIKVS